MATASVRLEADRDELEYDPDHPAHEPRGEEYHLGPDASTDSSERAGCLGDQPDRNDEPGNREQERLNSEIKQAGLDPVTPPRLRVQYRGIRDDSSLEQPDEQVTGGVAHDGVQPERRQDAKHQRAEGDPPKDAPLPPNLIDWSAMRSHSHQFANLLVS